MKRDERIKSLLDSMVDLQGIKKYYTPSSPGWILVHTAQGHIKSIYHLESETNFDSETLGVKDE